MSDRIFLKQDGIGEIWFGELARREKSGTGADINGTVFERGEQRMLEDNGRIFVGDGDVYAFFINEAAYYEKDVAFMLAQKKEMEVSFPWVED